MFLQGFPIQVGQRGPVGNRKFRLRSPEVSQHSQVEKHNEIVLGVRHAEVRRAGLTFSCNAYYSLLLVN